MHPSLLRSTLPILTLVLIFSAPRVVIAQPQSDPAVLSLPGAPPPFRDLIAVSDWDKTAAKALARMAHPEHAGASIPAAGERVIATRPDGPAAVLGLLPGDAITEVDGVSIATARFKALRADHDQLITVVNAGKVRQLTIPAGEIGIRSTWFYRPVLTYLRGNTRDARWDKYVFVALANDRVNPALAETAWAAAFKAGYKPDWLSDLAGAEIAWRDRRNDDALAFLAQLQSRDAVPAEVRLPDLARQLAIANFKIPQALAGRIAPDPGPPTLDDAELADYLTNLLQQHQALPDPQRLTPSPSELAAAHGETDILSQMTPVPADRKSANKYDHQLAAKLARHESTGPLEVQADRFFDFAETPSVDDPEAHLTIQLKYKAHDDRFNDRPRTVIVGLVNCDDPKYLPLAYLNQHGCMLDVVLEATGACVVNQGSDHQFAVQQTSVHDERAGYHELTLHLYHAAGREEVWIDHRRLLYLPSLEHPQRIGFYLEISGCTCESRVDFTQIKIK